METFFAQAARKRSLTARQFQIVVGSLLGDATLLATTRGYCFRVHHGLLQQSFADWKYRELSQFVRTPPRVSGAGYYFRTISHPEFTGLREKFYRGSRKIAPVTLLSDCITPLALAVWIMDDGSADGNALRINTQSFSSDECQALSRLLCKNFQLEFTINTDKGKPRLRCRTSSMKRLTALIEPHVIPEMRYKLP